MAGTSLNLKVAIMAHVKFQINEHHIILVWQFHSHFQEAAIFIKEGVEHIKFSDRPTEKISNFVYTIVNNIAYRIYHLVLTVALLLLAFPEFPTVFLEEDPSAFSTYQSDWLRVSQSTYGMIMSVGSQMTKSLSRLITASYELIASIYNNS